MTFKRHSEPITLWFSRLSFPNVFIATPIVRDGRPIGEPFFSLIAILHDEIAPRVEAVQKRIIARTWPEWPDGQPPGGIILKKALKRGEIARPGDPHVAGKWILNCNAKKDSKPWVVMKDPATGQYLPVTDHSLVYGGCEAHVSVGIYSTQIQAAAPQIDVGLNGIELTGRAMPSFENRATAEQALGAGPDIAAPPPPPGGPDVPAPDTAPAQPIYDPSDPMTW